MRTRLLMIVAVGLLLAADKADDAIKAEIKKLQGDWEAQSLQSLDAKTPEEDLKGLRLVIDGDKWTNYRGDKKGTELTWKVDPSKDPKHLDLTVTRNGKKVVVLCVYELKGDTLTVCRPFKNPGERPTKIAPAEGTGVAVWKRVKK
jgi:uncharacterized protein (TIGR03067 family)